MAATARIMEKKRVDEGFQLRLKVKLREGAYIYLRGWVHEGCRGGRFTDEFPSDLFGE
jgi:hypothetical protein